jgi:hypothetical protein
MSKYDTNLAAEFHVLSILHRLGADASLTLGHKKAVDIFVARKKGKAFTIDVKGVAGPYDWHAVNVDRKGKDGHFLVLVSYEGKIDDPEQSPSVWVVPSKHIGPFIRKYRSLTNISRAMMIKEGRRYWHAWRRILGRSATKG